VCFADPGRSQEDHVLSVGQEAERGQLLDLLAVNRGLEAEVEVGQGLDESEVGQTGLGDEAAFGAARGLGFEQPLQESNVAQGLLGGLLRDGVQELGHPLQLEPFEVGLDPFVAEVQASSS
jgi:hypothetical protein